MKLACNQSERAMTMSQYKGMELDSGKAETEAKKAKAGSGMALCLPSIDWQKTLPAIKCLDTSWLRVPQCGKSCQVTLYLWCMWQPEVLPRGCCFGDTCVRL